MSRVDMFCSHCVHFVHGVVRTCALLVAGVTMGTGAADPFDAERNAMLEDIARTARDAASESGRPIIDERVMQAMSRVARHRLVPPSETFQAYRNHPVAIGFGQTISQPFIVALMTDLLEVNAGDKVLEIGTGSGYQAAVLAELGANVYSVEIVEPLAREAQQRLAKLGYGNVAFRIGDGNFGWPEHAPFDSIVVTAAAREIPPALIAQLRPGGRLVIPIGSASGVQTLYLVEKKTDAATSQRPVLSVRFVPLTGGAKKE